MDPAATSRPYSRSLGSRKQYSSDRPKAFRCLSIDEIQQNIIDALWADGSNEGTLSSLAATCRTLHTIPVAALWREMDSLVPLLKTIPGFEWHAFSGLYRQGERLVVSRS